MTGLGPCPESLPLPTQSEGEGGSTRDARPAERGLGDRCRGNGKELEEEGLETRCCPGGPGGPTPPPPPPPPGPLAPPPGPVPLTTWLSDTGG